RQELPEAVVRKKRETIDRLLTRARAGEDFAKLARENTEDKGTKDKGGEVVFPRGVIGSVEFESAAFALGVNQISEVLTSKYGFHIVKLLEKMPAKMVPYAEVSARIKEALLQQEVQKRLPDYLAKLKQEAGVEILDASLKN
ncbi:MAG: peptidylprolyl isomerase, partial [Pedosphaera parvula]|nr:peptidylprolyl isomerase [Pedosphaera parvula]